MNGWQSIIRFLAHCIGRVRLHLRARWAPPLGGFLLTVVLLAVADVFFAKTAFPPFMELNKNWHHQFGDWLNLWMILAVYTIAWLLIWSVQARSRMVVEKFVNYAGADFEQAAQGASMLLLVKLGQLQDLYQTVDEQRAIATSALDRSISMEHAPAVDAAITVDSMEAFLKNAVTTQSTLSVGPLQIPLGILLSLVGHVTQGPRIISSFHRDKTQEGKDLLLLVAQASRNGRAFTWRIERALSPQQPYFVDLTDMLDEFAARIFTDMTLRSTVRWRAAAHFAEGLRAYRECLRTPKERISHLRRAEEHFIETLTEDTQYMLAHYNLGVVLTELHHEEAAVAAFERAIGEDPRSVQAYYALALSCYQHGQFYRASQLCKRVIDLKPDASSIARAYQLRALALAEQENGSGSPTICAAAIKNCKIAIKYAHKALRRAEIAQQDDATSNNNRIAKAEILLSVCIGSLAKLSLPELLAAKRTPIIASLGEEPPAEPTLVSRSAMLASSMVPLWQTMPELLASKHEPSAAKCIVSHELKPAHLRYAERLLNYALHLHSSDASYDVLYHWQLGKICFAEGNWKDASQHMRIAVRAAPDCLEYLADLIFVQACAVAASTKENQDKPLDWGYEEFLFQTLLDLISATKKETVVVVLETVLNAYNQDVPTPAKYREKWKRVRMIRTYIQFGCSLHAYAAAEELAAMTTSQLARYDAEYEKKYAVCTKACYSGGRECHEASSSASQGRGVIVPAQMQFTGINKALCLSQVVLARGRIKLQLSRGKENGIRSLIELQQMLAQFEQEQDIDDIVTDSEAQKQPEGTVPFWEWERGQILSTLAMLYYETGKRMCEMGEPAARELFEKARGYYHTAIQLLKKYPLGISVQNLRASLASVLLELPNQQQEALKVAQDCILLDSMNYKNYEILGDVYFTYADFSDAIDTWKQAIARKNTTTIEINDPNLYMKLGSAYVALAQSRHGVCLNDEQCLEALRYLEHALKCCTDEHVLQKLKAYCALGYLHFTRGEYDQAIKYLCLTQSFGFAPCTSTFYLASAHLRKRDYDAACEQFRLLEKLTAHLVGDADDILEAESGSPICLNEMKALAYWGQVYAQMERDIYLKDALHLAERACILAEQVPAEKLQFPSRYLHCKGWLLFNLDEWELLEKSHGVPDQRTSNRERAIEALLKAARLEALPENYLHLALASQDRLTQLKSASERQRLLPNIRAYYLRARELNGDDDNLFRQQVDELLKGLPV